ncbi:uncharacterized protein TrAtP1_002725 [Trichoderma atroviride]|uniref:uncharacterized protein n=1 Tax=Hypocrea atroviridis TaxID=63577 RepID=UPI00332A1B9D|nr:hypothetical protein TrAtP1_002725 [Trichoderma atroviride]
MSINDIDEMFNDLEEADVEDNGPSTATEIPSGSDKYEAFTDENGLLRIGRQPSAPSVHVKWAPRKAALARIRLSVVYNFWHVNRRIQTSAPVDHDSERDACQEKLIEALTEHGADGDKLTGTCGYTGADFLWGPGYELHITSQNESKTEICQFTSRLLRL